VPPAKGKERVEQVGVLGAPGEMLLENAFYIRVGNHPERIHCRAAHDASEKVAEGPTEELSDGDFEPLLGAVDDLIGQMAAVGVAQDSLTLAAVKLEL